MIEAHKEENKKRDNAKEAREARDVDKGMGAKAEKRRKESVLRVGRGGR